MCEEDTSFVVCCLIYLLIHIAHPLSDRCFPRSRDESDRHLVTGPLVVQTGLKRAHQWWWSRIGSNRVNSRKEINMKYWWKCRARSYLQSGISWKTWTERVSVAEFGPSEVVARERGRCAGEDRAFRMGFSEVWGRQSRLQTRGMPPDCPEAAPSGLKVCPIKMKLTLKKAPWLLWSYFSNLLWRAP